MVIKNDVEIILDWERNIINEKERKLRNLMYNDPLFIIPEDFFRFSTWWETRSFEQGVGFELNVDLVNKFFRRLTKKKVYIEKDDMKDIYKRIEKMINEKFNEYKDFIIIDFKWGDTIDIKTVESSYLLVKIVENIIEILKEWIMERI